MLPNRLYKNKLRLGNNPDPTERRENLTKEALKDSTFFPEPLTYEDIDQAMMDWSNDILDLSFEGEKIPTVALYTNQRFEEYMQEWEHSDDKHNMLLNFKTITRENNPKKGSINGDKSNNIPGNREYTMRREKIIDRNGQESYIDYCMKQPIAVDLSYTISLVTGKYELINMFNMKVQDIFKSGYNYLHVNGHYVYMKMEDPSDESEYAIDDRRYFSQKAKITVKAYIIQKEDFSIHELLKARFKVSEGGNEVPVSIEEDEEAVIPVDGRYYKPLALSVNFTECDSNDTRIKVPYEMVVQKTVFDNVKLCKVTQNGETITVSEKENTEFEFESGVMTKIWIKRENPLKVASVLFEGYDKDVVFTEEDLSDETSGEYLQTE